MIRRVVTAVLTAIVGGAAAFSLAFVIARARTAAPRSEGLPRASASASAARGVLWQVPAFSFPDQNGRTTTAADLRAHVWIADFIFTKCTSICPLITARMAVLQRRLEHRKNLRFVSFSVDPERDSPEVLKAYAGEWRPGETRWLLLSTTPPGLEKLAAGMFVAVEPDQNDIAHSNLFFLVDAAGGVRGIYESDKNDALDRLVSDTEALLKAEPSVGSSVAATGSKPQPGDLGASLYGALGCGACHSRKDLAPPIEGLLGRPVELAGGGTVVADRAYVRESIVRPEARLARGYSLRMPGYGQDLAPDELEALVAHTIMLATKPARAASTTEKAQPSASAMATPAASSTAEEPAEKALVAIDPVCGMDVRVAPTTPRASHAGHTFYFCSEMCRERFVAEPARYAKKPP